MDEKKAKAFAKVLGGNPWQSGGNIWLVVMDTSDGRVITFSDEVVIEYQSREAFENDQQKQSIIIA